ncbi:hypothetical protein LOTGIDRAFT_166470 [Lottia gigantea]|uniref:EGF-like domain-containing protein n=1 Tax=Lottia gigantea TaxID=225164 RepID=V4BFB2_LOTGI|nr:hypothetical protein LOTGIDRAFT_166470 [Lottia gigantea]ESO87589.1 hypothetical protein LOTGIDRAFT_166470 [Lottia gigantea]
MATRSRWIFSFILLTSATLISGEDCFDFLCYYANNCESGLNNVTGNCVICAEGWSGKKCQKKNVALKKPEYVDIPKNSGSNYDIIVDGKTTQDKTSCIEEYRLDVDIYLDVNLMSLYYIKDVSIYYMKGAVASLRGFSVFIGNTSTFDEGELCYQHKDEPLQDITTISCNKTGQYLKMKNSRANPPYPGDYSDETDLQICEIQAFGCEGKYGPNCGKQCLLRKCKGTSSCNTFDGKCETGCKSGYRGDDCVQECLIGFYGESCSQRCNNNQYCKISTDCNHITGYCNNGCQTGWTGPKCNLVCNSGTFGDNCQQKCHCYGTDVCHHVTGSCPGTGRLKCEEGWSGDSCDQDCAGKYGTSCEKQCYQRQCKGTSSCNTFDGKCETGCKSGYTAEDCTQECSFGTYGDVCSKQCNSDRHFCDEVGCDPVTGECKGDCQPGWLGNRCNEECQVGQYGVNCMYNCNVRHCINMTECNFIDGSCNGNCEDGWSGVDCVQAGAVVQDNGLDRLYVGLIGVLCGLVFCIVIAIIIYFLCRSRWRRKLLVSERRRTKEVIYDDIPDLPPDIAVNNNLYEEPSTESRSFDNLSNRPLPRIVVDSSSGSNLVRAKHDQRESRPYENQTGPYERVDETNDQSITRTKVPVTTGSDMPNLQRSTQSVATSDRNPYIDMSRGNQAVPNQSSSSVENAATDQAAGARRSVLEPKEGDTDSISTVGSCCSDKLHNEQNEVRDAAENVQKRKENEYVKMGDMSGTRAKTNSDSGNPGEGYVNRSFC